MKFLLTTPTYPPHNSGLGNAVHRQAEALAKRGHEVVVATGGQSRLTRHDSVGVRIEQFAVSGAAYLRNPIRGDIAGYRQFLVSERCDALIMHAWQIWSTDIPLSDLGALPGRKYVFSHCISTNLRLPYMPIRSLAFYLLWRPYWWALPRRMRELDGVIFLADGGDDDRFDDLKVARQVGVPIHVVSNSLPDGAIPDDKLERTQIVSVGSYTPAKGFDFVLESYARSSAYNVLPLALFGQEYTPYLETLQRQATSLGIRPEMIAFRTGVAGDDLIHEYQRARLFVSGSYTECQPLVLLDAMATSTPFVARATGCISRMPGGQPVWSVREAAEQINRLLEDADEWARLAAAGHNAALTQYSMDRNVELLIDAVSYGFRGRAI